MTRRTLIFFTSADPRDEGHPLFRAYHFATVAASAGLDAEVRLAGPAVDLAHPDVQTLPHLASVREKMAGGVDGSFLVSL